MTNEAGYYDADPLGSQVAQQVIEEHGSGSAPAPGGTDRDPEDFRGTW
jgi:hypothetical protein